MNRAVALAAIFFAAACSSLPDAGNGIVGLQIRLPDTANGSGCTSSSSCTLVQGASLTLAAHAINLQGDSVAAMILWITFDTTFVSLDSLHGIVTAKRDTTGSAQVQATVGTLRSDPITIVVTRDTATSSVRARP